VRGERTTTPAFGRVTCREQSKRRNAEEDQVNGLFHCLAETMCASHGTQEPQSEADYPLAPLLDKARFIKSNVNQNFLLTRSD